ncbi:extracellular solute-binding protein [Bradyrhizobium commune]|uniref:Extracellular solute-binding protein n=1 Tax=Bradyrhizobium commune TaxID=83627 RepID=A0A7S9GYE5_9BRAD|nr:extracellular solute-binding protein [Bradyrhizobium commune]QPF90795.1 extracellular solute-binding protein [Bradyrhizobium commune]
MMKAMSLLVSAVAGALIGATAACADPVTLRVGYAFPARDGLFRQPIIERFMQQNPDVRIVTEANAADCPALLQQLLRAAVTGDLPDVVASLCYPDMPVLAERGLLVPLDGFLASDPSWAAVGVAPGALAATEWKGKTIALPESVSTSIVYYNMDIIRKVRPDLSNLDLSWNEILSLANDIRRTAPAFVPIFFEYYPDSYNWSFHALVYSHGGDVFTPDGKIAFDGPAGQAALQLMRRFGEAGMVDMTSEQARQAFASGKIGIYVASNSRLEQLTANAGPALDIRTGPFPQSAVDGRMPSGGGGLAIMARDPAKQRAAWKYLKFALGPEAQTLMVSKTGFTPVNTIAIKDPKYLGDYFKSKPNALAGLAEVARIKSMNVYPGENGGRITAVIRDHLQSIVTLKRTPDEALPDMVRDVRKLLPKP